MADNARLARRDDAPHVLPADLRRGRRGAGARDVFAQKHGLRTDVRIPAQAMTTDTPTPSSRSMMKLVGSDMARRAARQVYEEAGVGPEDIDVVELHDCFAHNELISYEALGLCHEGGAEKFVGDGDNTYGGKVVTNPSGGLLSKGHPLGATGLAQCYELMQQLRGRRAAPGRGRAARAAAQPRPRRRLRRHAVRTHGLTSARWTPTSSRQSPSGPTCRPCSAGSD